MATPKFYDSALVRPVVSSAYRDLYSISIVRDNVVRIFVKRTLTEKMYSLTCTT